MSDSPHDPPPTGAEASSASTLLSRLGARKPSGARYALRGEVSRGGMGAILSAWDDELRRTVAMKVALAPDTGGSDASGTLGRFLEEAQVTGQLEHPGIVPVHELGVDEQGRVFFTMRMVAGDDLRTVFEHVRAGRDGWTQVRVLGLVLKACEAVAFAHSKGVLHRDLKPANVMVGRFGEVYVMDWGLARVVGRPDTRDLRLAPAPAASSIRSVRRDERAVDPDSPIVTMDGDVLGTPAFMSPEQARGELDGLGPHSDVYALGAMLYELVTGEMPYVPAGARVSPRTVLAAVLAGPPRPVEDLAPRTPPELVAIVERAMARDVARRYPDTQELAHDLRAYLEGRVVRAYETGTWAETRKWVRRNKALAGALLAVLASTAGGVAAFAVQAQRADAAAHVARANEHEARASAARADAVTAFVQRALEGSDPFEDGDRELLVTDAMESAVRELDRGALSDDPRTEAALRSTIAEVLLSNGRYAQALEQAERSLSVRRQSASTRDTELGGSLDQVAVCLTKLERPGEALPLFEESLALHERLHPDGHASVAEALDHLASCHNRLGDAATEIAVRERSLAAFRALDAPPPQAFASALMNAGVMRSRLHDEQGALALQAEALSLLRGVHAGDHPELVRAMHGLAETQRALRHDDEALALHDDALAMARRLAPGDDVLVARCLGSLAEVLEDLGRVDEAFVHGEASVAMFMRLFDGDRTEIAAGLSRLASMSLRAGRFADAQDLFEAGLAMRRRVQGPDHPDVVRGLTNLAECLRRRRQSAEAVVLLDEALAMTARLSGEPDALTAFARLTRAKCLRDQGLADDALLEARAARAIASDVLPVGDGMRVAIEELVAGLGGDTVP